MRLAIALRTSGQKNNRGDLGRLHTTCQHATGASERCDDSRTREDVYTRYNRDLRGNHRVGRNQMLDEKRGR